MKKSALCVLAVLAGAVSTSAVAKDLKQNKQAVSATQMSESEMDNVTAGAAGQIEMCNTANCQFVGAGGQSFNRAENNGYYNSNGNRGAYFYQSAP
jgi:hypothetical protein